MTSHRAVRLFAAGYLASIGGVCSEPLRAGYSVVPPLSFHIDGKPSGFTIDVVNEAARRENIKLEWVVGGPSLKIETSLSAGALDIVPAGMVTPDRQRRFFVSAPWWFAELSLMTREGVHGTTGKSMGLGSPIYRIAADSVFPGIPQVPYPDALQAMSALCRGEVDSALLMHMDVHRLFLYKPQEASDCRFASVRVSETRAQIELAVLARREMEAPALRLRKRIDELALDGTLARLATRYPDLPASGGVKLADSLRVRYARQKLRIVILSVSIVLVIVAFFVRRLHREVQAQRRTQARVARAHRIALLGDWELDFATGGLDLSEGALAFCCAPRTGPAGLGVFLSYVAPEDADRVRNALERAGTGTEIDISYTIDHPTDGRRYVRLIAEPLQTGGRTTGLAGTIQDLTEHRKLTEQLQQAQKMETVGRLAGGVAHDFNNLLTVIGGYAGILLDTLTPADPSREMAATIAEGSDRAAALTRQLLAFSRQQRPEFKIVSLNEIVENLKKMLRRLIGEDVDLTMDLDPDTPSIRADVSQIEQVVTNLVVNARDAMPDGGSIVLRTKRRALSPTGDSPSGDHAELTVSDTGVGISADVLPHIFEPFFTTKERGKGTGLGLSIVYGIVGQSGGTIDVRSQPGQGTTFEILFPATYENSAAGTEASQTPRDVSGNATLLVVEDEPGVRSFVCAVLRSGGYRVLEAANGRKALEMASEHAGPIHLLLTDVIMPAMGGVELADRLIAMRPEMSVLFMSGYTERVDSPRIQDKLLLKPFLAGDLLHRVRQAIPARAADRTGFGSHSEL